MNSLGLKRCTKRNCFYPHSWYSRKLEKYFQCTGKTNRYVDVSASNAREVRIRKATEQDIKDGRKLLP